MKLGKKIILHNLTFRGIEVVPGVLDFDQRGVVYLNKDDIIITKNPIEQEYLKYLEELGWDFSRCTFLNPSITKDYTYNTVFYDKEIISKIKKIKDYYIDTYNTTFEEEDFAKKMQVPIYANCKLSQLYGTKSGFRKLAKNLGLKIAYGFEEIRNIDSLKNYIEKFFKKGKLEVAIKIDEGISGAGTTKIKSRDYKKLSTEQKAEFFKKALYKIKQAQSNSGVVVEEWLSNVTASPSIQVEVYPDKTWKIVSMHDQLLEGDEKWYVGCKYPQTTLDNKKLQRVQLDVAKFVKFLISKGFIGFLGLDIVITKDDNIFWVEANIRKPGTFYPRIIAEKLNNGLLDGLFYIATDFTVPKFKGVSFLKLKEEFSEFLYLIKKQSNGVVLYNTGALKDAGRFDLVCLGQNAQTVQDVYTTIKEKINKLKGA